MSAGLGRLFVLVPPTAPAARGESPTPKAEPLGDHVRGPNVPQDAWVVESDELLQAPRGIVVTREGHGFAPERGELWFAGETAESVLLELEGRRQRLETRSPSSRPRRRRRSSGPRKRSGSPRGCARPRHA